MPGARNNERIGKEFEREIAAVISNTRYLVMFSRVFPLLLERKGKQDAFTTSGNQQSAKSGTRISLTYYIYHVAFLFHLKKKKNPPADG